MTDDFSEQQYELMLPWQLRAAVKNRAVAYIPLGTFEWHCEHLPVGLDALTAHGLCLRAAKIDGGVVLPALHYGTGGGHGDYPWTMIMSDEKAIAAQLDFTLAKLKSFGFKRVVLFSGHFPDAQLNIIDALASAKSDETFKVQALAVNRIEGLAIAPDHAGLFETTLLFAMWPNLVQIDRLPSLKDKPLDVLDVWEEGRHNPSHPIWGVVGADPRHFKPSAAKTLLDASITWIVQQLHNAS